MVSKLLPFVMIPLFALLLASCGGTGEDKKEPLPFEPAGPNSAPATDEIGPFPVGVTTLDLKITGRKDKDGNPAPDRPLKTEVWYPATEEFRGKPGYEYQLKDEFPEDKQAEFADVEIPTLPTDAVRDASPRRDRGPYPFVIFSHGNGGVRFQSIFFTLTLASHGYVVASPDHHGDTVMDLIDKGGYDEAAMAESFIDRPKDAKFLVDEFERQAKDKTAFFYKMADTSNVAVTGHSFGAVTAYRSTQDERVKAIIPMTGPDALQALLGVNSRPNTILIPKMVMGGMLDQTLEYGPTSRKSYDERLAAPKYLAGIRKGGHFTFTEICRLDLIRIADKIGFGDAASILNDGCTEDFLPPDEAHKVINYYAISFINFYMRGSEGAAEALSPSAKYSSDVEYEEEP